MLSGRIIKGIGGFYYVKNGAEVFECKASGKFRVGKNKKGDTPSKEKIVPMVGDKIYFDEEKKLIEEIFPRKNFLVRPAVSNIDQLVIVVATADPAPDFVLIDKLTVLALSKEIQPIIVINKIDLKKPSDIENIYKNIFKTIKISATKKKSLSKIKKLLKKKTTAFAGNSGVGKSSVLTALGLEAPTGETSKIHRGKHTTRHVELMEFCKNTYVLDTPGFSILDASEIGENPMEFFPESENIYCEFKDCKHLPNSKGCKVREKMSETRYKSYLEISKERGKK